MRNSTQSLKGCDVAVIGGGVAGLAAARSLARRGLSVAVIETARPGAGASQAAGGMLAPQSEADRHDELFELLCASREMYPSFAAELYEESGVDIELDRTGALYVALTEADEDEIERRYLWQSRASLAVERLAAAEARSLEPAVSESARGALLFPRDWQVENRHLIRALAASCMRLGVRIFTQTEARGVRVEAGHAKGVETARGYMSAGAVVLAAGAWASRVPLLTSASDGDHTPSFPHVEIEPVRGQMLCFEHEPTHVPPIRHVLYSPRGYLVPRRDGRVLAGSTTEHAGFDCIVTAGGVETVTRNAIELAPGIRELRLTDSWAGLRPLAADGWPVLGECAQARGLFYAAGLYRNGILLAPAVGEIISGLVAEGRASLLPHTLARFSPARFHTALAVTHKL